MIIEPRRTTGLGPTHTEVYLVEQVVAVFEDDRAILVTHDDDHGTLTMPAEFR